LLHVGIALGRWREDAGDIQWQEAGINCLLLGLHSFEEGMIFNRVINRSCGEQGIEPALTGGRIMFGQDSLDDCPLRERFARLRQRFSLWLEVVDMKPKDVSIINSMRNCVRVKALREEIFRRHHTGL